MTYIVVENQKALKNSFQAISFKAEENSRTFQGKMEFKDFSRTSPKIHGLFKDLHRNLRAFQGKMEFKDFSRTSPKIQGLFKTVRTLQIQKKGRTDKLGVD